MPPIPKKPDTIKSPPVRRIPDGAEITCQRVIRDPLDHQRNMAKGDTLSHAQLNAIGQKKVLNLVQAGVLAVRVVTPQEATEVKNGDLPPTSHDSTDPAASVTSPGPSGDSETENPETENPETDDSDDGA